jgi:hypothetical protein
LTSRVTRSTVPFVLARYGRQALGQVPRRAATSTRSETKIGDPSTREPLISAVSRSVRNSALAPPTSSTQRTIAARVVTRVLSVAKWTAGIRLEPRIATKAYRIAFPSPSGQLPQSVQSPGLDPGSGLESDLGLTGVGRRRDRLQSQDTCMKLHVLHRHGWSIAALAREFGLNLADGPAVRERRRAAAIPTEDPAGRSSTTRRRRLASVRSSAARA